MGAFYIVAELPDRFEDSYATPVSAIEESLARIGQYAAERGWEPSLPRAALDYLVIRGYLNAEDGCFELSERGRSLEPYFGYLPSSSCARSTGGNPGPVSSDA